MSEKKQSFEEYICSNDALLKSDVQHLGRLLVESEELGNEIAKMYRDNAKTLKAVFEVITLDLQRRIVNDATPYEVIPLRNKLEAIDSVRALLIAIEKKSTFRISDEATEKKNKEKEALDPNAKLEKVIGGDNASSM